MRCMPPLSRRDLATAGIIRPRRRRIIVPARATRAKEETAGRCQMRRKHDIVATYSSCAINSPWRLTRQEFRSRTDQRHVPVLDLQYAATLYFSFINAPQSTHEDKKPSAWVRPSLLDAPAASVRPERTHMRSNTTNTRYRKLP
ncbi:hypothetical protein LY78DRAFT_35294 [Colletotrichum sublineola]|nr:hypothetical protein LY78DRAFT_35294 [Colletotrichum sublineola]